MVVRATDKQWLGSSLLPLQCRTKPVRTAMGRGFLRNSACLGTGSIAPATSNLADASASTASQHHQALVVTQTSPALRRHHRARHRLRNTSITTRPAPHSRLPSGSRSRGSARRAPHSHTPLVCVSAGNPSGPPQAVPQTPLPRATYSFPGKPRPRQSETGRTRRAQGSISAGQPRQPVTATACPMPSDGPATLTQS